MLALAFGTIDASAQSLPTPAAASAPAIAPATDAWRAALPHDPEAATQAYLGRLSPEARARSDAYFEGGYWLQLWNLLLALLTSWLLLQARPAQAARRWCASLSQRRFVQVTSYAAFYVLATWLLSLPLAIYQGFVREHEYGMATRQFAAWFGEQAMSLGITLVIAPLFVLALYAVIRRAPRYWWLGAAAVAMVFMVIGLVLAPVYIEPLFNTYKPLADTPLKRSILAMALANGVPVSNVYEFDASRQTTRVSANVTGLWGTAAVRLNDNLLRETSDAEIRAVVAHEIGHFAMNHIATSLMQFGLVIIVAFALVAWSSAALLRRYGVHWQLSGVQDVGSLPLLAAVFSVVMFVATPVTNTITRTMEIEADLYGLNLAREPDGEAEVLLKLVEYRKADPGPVEEAIFFDHPAARTRIYNAMRWKAQMQPSP
jgi:STE24 endopeptidase